MMKYQERVMSNQELPVILASSSQYRAEILTEVGINFVQIPPTFDENQHNDKMSPTEWVKYLARGKARSIAISNPDSLIIGGDQIFIMDGEIGGKMKNKEQAVKRLMRMRGKKLTFLTAVCLIDTREPEPGMFGIELENMGKVREEVILLERTFVIMRSDLTQERIKRYVESEEGLNCAGGVMVEGKGAAFVEEVQGDMFNLRGLPLFKVLQWLSEKEVWAF
jgi:septum formation protein